MDKEDLIPADDFCTRYSVSYTFIRTLQEAGLAELTVIEDQSFIPGDQLHELEKLARLHTDLDINLEGIEAIAHLLKRMEHMQQELRKLRRG